MQHHVQVKQATFYRYLRRVGVKVNFVLYDLLPLLKPEFFPDDTFSDHRQWVMLSQHMDGVFCISKTVAIELEHWLAQNADSRVRKLNVEWFHIGADIESSRPSMGLPDSATSVLQKITNTVSFLSVGTIEPRKGQSQTLAAFEELWAEGSEATLVLVGKRGWNVDELADRLLTHPMANTKLFWLDGISDEYLERVYAACTCLIAASEGEGFGLPLIEAAQHGMPIIARDLPVFKEVAGDHAFYFGGDTAGDLTSAMKAWLELYSQNTHPSSTQMGWLTWEESTQQLKRLILAS